MANPEFTATKSAIAAGSHSYVPALRWKQGEIDALNGLAEANMLNGATPLLLIDTTKEREQHATRTRIPSDPGLFIDHVAGEVQKLLQNRLAAYIDTRHFDYANEDYDGLVSFFSTFHAQNMNAIPVFRRADGAVRRKTLRPIAKERGACVRLRISNIHGTEVVEELEALISELGVDDRSTDIIFDLWQLSRPYTDAVDCARRMQIVLAAGNWRRCALIAGSFQRPADGTTTLPARVTRYEVDAYAGIMKALKSKTPVSFGDFGIVYPNAHPADQKGASGQFPIIRYSTQDAWYVWRSETGPDRKSIRSYRDLSRDCATYTEFMGAEFSPGDTTIENIARDPNATLGNPSSWVGNDTSHHIAYTMRQFAKTLSAPKPISRSECRHPGNIA